MRRKYLWFVSFVVLARVASAQSSFQDLNFEDANPVPYQGPPGGATTASAFPGWEALYGTTPTPSVAYDTISAGSAQITLVDNNVSDDLFPPLQGKYSALLDSALGTTTTLSQTGLVPAGTESLTLDAFEQFSTFTVSVNGQTVPLTALQTLTGYTEYGGDVSQWAGQDVTLSITENLPNGLPGQTPSWLELDNINFSTTSVPEPSPLLLTGIASLMFGARRQWMRKR